MTKTDQSSQQRNNKTTGSVGAFYPPAPPRREAILTSSPAKNRGCRLFQRTPRRPRRLLHASLTAVGDPAPKSPSPSEPPQRRARRQPGVRQVVLSRRRSSVEKHPRSSAQDHPTGTQHLILKAASRLPTNGSAARGGGGGCRHKPGAVLAAEKLEKEEETGLQVLPSLPPPRSVAFPCLVHRELRGSRSGGRLGGGSPARGSRAAPARQSTVPPSPALAGLGDAHDSRGYGDRAAARPSPGTPPPLGSLIQPMPPRYRTAPGRRTRSSPAAEAVAHGAVGG